MSIESMESGSSRYERWLEAERDDDEAGAEAAFAHVFTQLPRVEASPDFPARAARAAWRVRARRRLVTGLGRVAAVLLVGIISLVVAYQSLALVLTGIVRGVVLLSRFVVWSIVALDDGVTWWSIAQRAGAGISQAVTAPASAAALFVVEVVAAFAMYAFHLLLRQEHRDSQKGHS